MFFFTVLKYFGGQRNDFHVGGTQFTGYRAEDTATSHFTGTVQQHTGVVVETDIGTVGTTNLFGGAHNNGFGYGTFFQVARRNDAFNGNYDDVAYRRITTTGTA